MTDSYIVCFKHTRMDINMYVEMQEGYEYSELFNVWISGHHLLVRSPDLQSLVLAFLSMRIKEIIDTDFFVSAEDKGVFLLADYDEEYQNKRLIEKYSGNKGL